MNKREEIIYKAYKSFYSREPDFSKENKRNITIEIQSMFYILQEYGIYLGGDGFSKSYKDLDLPMDMGIQDVLVYNLIGKDNSLNSEAIEFKKDVNKSIKMIGEVVCDTINTSDDPIAMLRLLTYTLYLKKHVVPGASDEVVEKLANCSSLDLDCEKKMIKKLDNLLVEE